MDLDGFAAVVEAAMDNTGSGSARREADLAAGRDPEFDFERHFLHDLPDDARAELLSAGAREPSAAAVTWSR